jgi:hypothetical protein
MIKTDHKRITHALKKRGWQKKHIDKVAQIMKKGEKNKPKGIKILDGLIYWIILVFVLLGNMIVLAGSLPIILEMPEWVLIIVLSIIGLGFGFLVDTLIRDINMSIGNYLFAGFLIPVIATINMLFILEIAKIVAKMIGIIIKMNPLLVVFFYIVSFSLPHVLYKINEQRTLYNNTV